MQIFFCNVKSKSTGENSWKYSKRHLFKGNIKLPKKKTLQISQARGLVHTLGVLWTRKLLITLHFPSKCIASALLILFRLTNRLDPAWIPNAISGTVLAIVARCSVNNSVKHSSSCRVRGSLNALRFMNWFMYKFRTWYQCACIILALIYFM